MRIALFFLALCLAGCIQSPNGAAEGGEGAEADLALLEELATFPEWRMETSEGTIRTILYTDWLPETTANIVRLTEAGYYDGTLVYRVIDDFVIQGGDENESDVDILLANEGVPLEVKEGLDFGTGAMGLARLTRDDGTAHYFIAEKPALHLSRPGSVGSFAADPTPQTAQRAAYGEALGAYALYGQTFAGMDLVRTIAAVETDANDKPVEDIVLIQALVLPPPTDADLLNLIPEVYDGVAFDGADGIFEHPRIVVAGHPAIFRFNAEATETDDCMVEGLAYQDANGLRTEVPFEQNGVDRCTFEATMVLEPGLHRIDGASQPIEFEVLPWSDDYLPFTGTAMNAS